jgi:hypothetical protein
VLAALSSRAARPWWRQESAQWPAAARGAFLLLNATLAATLVWVLGGLNLAPATEAISENFVWINTLRAVAAAAGDLAMIVFRSLSPNWLYLGAIAVAALYAALFGLGTAAYRTLDGKR